MGLTLITPPSVLPLSLAEAKAIARLDDEDDALVAAFLRTATEQVEQHLGRALIISTWQYNVDHFPRRYGETIRIPIAPVQSVDEIRYVDLAGAVQTLDSSVYTISGIGDVARVGLAYGQSWPSTGCQAKAITIDLTAGHGDDWNAVPESIRTAICETVRGLYDGCRPAIDEMLQPWRVMPV
jgi:uncharacterized phiE125 gp8 family phage protein